MSTSSLKVKSRLRRQALKEFFAPKPHYTTQVEMEEFLISKGFAKPRGRSLICDMRKFGYIRTNNVWSPLRSSMEMMVRDRRGFLVKSLVFVREEIGYSKDSLDAYLRGRNMWDDKFLDV